MAAGPTACTLAMSMSSSISLDLATTSGWTASGWNSNIRLLRPFEPCGLHSRWHAFQLCIACAQHTRRRSFVVYRAPERHPHKPVIYANIAYIILGTRKGNQKYARYFGYRPIGHECMNPKQNCYFQPLSAACGKYASRLIMWTFLMPILCGISCYFNFTCRDLPLPIPRLSISLRFRVMDSPSSCKMNDVKNSCECCMLLVLLHFSRRFITERTGSSSSVVSENRGGSFQTGGGGKAMHSPPAYSNFAHKNTPPVSHWYYNVV